MMTDAPSKIEFTAEVVRVKTMADGGLRFEFGVGEDCIMQAAQLMECKRFGVAVNIVAVPSKTGQEQDYGKEQDNVEVGTKRKSQRATA